VDGIQPLAPSEIRRILTRAGGELAQLGAALWCDATYLALRAHSMLGARVAFRRGDYAHRPQFLETRKAGG